MSRSRPGDVPLCCRHAVVATFVASLLNAQQPAVPAWRVLRELEVAGSAAFDRDQVAAALVADGEAMRALQRPLDADAAAVVAARAAAFYRSAGYAAAAAAGSVQDGQLRLAITAGARLRCGPLRCRGNTAVSTGVLQERLAAAGEAKPAWRDGDWPLLDEAGRQRVMRAVDQAYRAVGRYGAVATVEYVPQDGQMVLDVTMQGEGREVVVEQVVLVGEDPAQQAEVLAALPFTSGCRATTETLDGIRTWLEATGRYVTVAGDVPADAPARLAPWTITVALRPDAPPFAAVPLRDVQQLRRALDRQGERLRSGGGLTIATTPTAAAAWGPLRMPGGEVAVALGPDGLQLRCAQLQWAGGPTAPAVLRFGADAIEWRHGERRGRCSWQRPLGMQLQLLSQYAANGEMEWRWGVGFSARGKDDVMVRLHPGTAARILSRVEATRRDGDDLVLEYGGHALRVLADGAVAGDRVEFDVDGQPWRVTLGTAATPAAAAAASEGDAVQLVLQVLHVLLAERMATTDERVRALLQGLVAAAATSAAAAVEVDGLREPAPSGGAAAGSIPQMIGAMLLQLAVDRRWQGRIVDLAAAFGSLLRGDVAVANAAFRAMVQDDGVGPLTMFVVAQVHELLGNERQVRAFRTLAASRSTFAAVWADGASLAASFPELHSLPARVGAAWRAEPGLRELFAGLPDGAAGDAAAWRRGLEHLWQHGGQELLRDALRVQ